MADQSNLIHVYPLADLREHDTYSPNCWCRPRIDDTHDLIIHNALDGRELFESGERKPS